MPEARTLSSALFAALLTLWSTGVAATGLVASAPSALPVLDDAPLTRLLAQHENTALIVNFWASWCEPCRDEMPALQRLAGHFQGRRVAVVTVAVADSAAASRRFLREAAVALPLLHDPEQTIARAWGVVMLPTTLVLDRRHRLIARASGPIEWGSAPVDRQLQDLLK